MVLTFDEKNWFVDSDSPFYVKGTVVLIPKNKKKPNLNAILDPKWEKWQQSYSDKTQKEYKEWQLKMELRKAGNNFIPFRN